MPLCYWLCVSAKRRLCEKKKKRRLLEAQPETAAAPIGWRRINIMAKAVLVKWAGGRRAVRSPPPGRQLQSGCDQSRRRFACGAGLYCIFISGRGAPAWQWQAAGLAASCPRPPGTRPRFLAACGLEPARPGIESGAVWSGLLRPLGSQPRAF